jgi:hypothetical protein
MKFFFLINKLEAEKVIWEVEGTYWGEFSLYAEALGILRILENKNYKKSKTLADNK